MTGTDWVPVFFVVYREMRCGSQILNVGGLIYDVVELSSNSVELIENLDELIQNVDELSLNVVELIVNVVTIFSKVVIKAKTVLHFEDRFMSYAASTQFSLIISA